jgi:murein DD-endopeptidase MepM/ murein hydrolase activator NlpD
MLLKNLKTLKFKPSSLLFMIFAFGIQFPANTLDIPNDTMSMEINLPHEDEKEGFVKQKSDDTMSVSIVDENFEKAKIDEFADFRYMPSEEFYLNWDTSVVDPYQYDLRELNYDFPLCLFISPDDNFSLPLSSLYRTSAFGPRWGRHHKGIDFDLNIGDSVLSCFDGMVRISTYSRTFGHFVVIRHLNGLETIYAHLNDREVVPGDIVKAGDCIGLGGNTGRSTGAHLHFEIRYLGIAFDPEILLDVQNQRLIDEELKVEKELFSYLNNPRLKSHKGASWYTIRSGDTLSTIARIHGTSVSQLCRLNGLKSTSIIRAGNRLRVK